MGTKSSSYWVPECKTTPCTWEAIEPVRFLDVVENGRIPVHIRSTLDGELGRVRGGVCVIEAAVALLTYVAEFCGPERDNRR